MKSIPRPLLALFFVLALFAVPFILVPQGDSSSSAALAPIAPAARPVPIEDAEIASNPTLVAPTVIPAVRAASNSAQTEMTEQSASRKAAKQGDSLFETLAKPLINETHKRRDERRKTEPDFAKRIDPKLNEGRINILLFGYGESHEPPATEKAIIGSQTILSYNYLTGKADLISFTHDIRGPEIEQALAKRGYKPPAVRIDQAYNTGGFALQRKLFEDATGLSIDFQITFKDIVIQNAVDQVFGGIDVDVPMAFKVYPFYLEGKKYPAGAFPKGAQTLNGTQVIQFIKTVPNTDGTYEKSLEHNQRKHIVLEGLLNAVTKRRAESSFWLKTAAFVTKEMVSGSVVYDFDPLTLVVKNVNETTAAINKLLSAEKSSGSSLPNISSSIYIVDPAHGDGGVQWINANASVNPITQRDLLAGIYTSADMEIPLSANPYGDLITEYWTSIRDLVKQTLAKNQP